jgi:hypothetical protein
MRVRRQHGGAFLAWMLVADAPLSDTLLSVDNRVVTRSTRVLAGLWLLAVVAAAGAFLGIVPWTAAGTAGLVVSGAVVVVSYTEDPESFRRSVRLRDVRRMGLTVAVALAAIIAIVVLANR